MATSLHSGSIPENSRSAQLREQNAPITRGAELRRGWHTLISVTASLGWFLNKAGARISAPVLPLSPALLAMSSGALLQFYLLFTLAVTPGPIWVGSVFDSGGSYAPALGTVAVMLTLGALSILLALRPTFDSVTPTAFTGQLRRIPA